MAGITPVPFEQVPRELRNGFEARIVLSRDRRWMAANDLRNVVSVVFATDGFVEHKALPKLSTVSDFSRAVSLALIRSKKSIEIRDTAKWKKLLSIAHAQLLYAVFSLDQSLLALLGDRAPSVAIHRVSDGSCVDALDRRLTIRDPVWVSDRVIVHSAGVIELPAAIG